MTKMTNFKKGCCGLMNKKIKCNCFFLVVIVAVLLTACLHPSNKQKNKQITINLENLPEYDLAISYTDAQNYEEAIAQFQYVLDNADMQKRGATEYWIKGEIGNCYMLMGEAEKAGPYILEAIQEIEKTEDSYYICRIYSMAGDYYWQISDYNKALEFYNKSLIYAEGEDIITANLGLAESYRSLGESKEMLEYYETAVTEGEKQNAQGSLVNVYYSMGIYWFSEGNLNEAEFCFKQGGEYAENTWGKDDIKVAESFCYLERVYSSRNDYQSAYSYCRQAMDIFQKQKDKYVYGRDIASLYNNMGFYNIEFKEYTTSLEMLKKSYDIVKHKMEQNEDFLDFYNNVLLGNIKALYNKSISGEMQFEDWFKRNFEDSDI